MADTMTASPEDMLTRAEVAEVLGVSVRWLEENTRSGPPFYKYTHTTLRYKRKEVEQWLKQKHVK